jgi:hypothetical protein
MVWARAIPLAPGKRSPLLDDDSQTRAGRGVAADLEPGADALDAAPRPRLLIGKSVT